MIINHCCRKYSTCFFRKKIFQLLVSLCIIFLSSGCDFFMPAGIEDVQSTPEELVQKMNTNYEGDFFLIGYERTRNGIYHTTTVSMRCSSFPGGVVHAREVINQISTNLWSVVFESDYYSFLYNTALKMYFTKMVSANYPQNAVFPCDDGICYTFGNVTEEYYIKTHANHASLIVVSEPREAAHERNFKVFLYALIRKKYRPENSKIFFTETVDITALKAEDVVRADFIERCYAAYEFFIDGAKYKKLK